MQSKNVVHLEMYRNSEIDKEFIPEVDGYIYDLDFIKTANNQQIELPENLKKHNVYWNMWSPAYAKGLTYPDPNGDGDEHLIKDDVQFNLYITNDFIDERDLRQDYQMILEICQHEKINLNVQHFKSQRNLPLDKLHPLLRKGKPDETQVILESKVEDMIEKLSQKKTKAEPTLDEVIDKAATGAAMDKKAPSKATFNRDNLSR